MGLEIGDIEALHILPEFNFEKSTGSILNRIVLNLFWIYLKLSKHLKKNPAFFV